MISLLTEKKEKSKGYLKSQVLRRENRISGMKKPIEKHWRFIWKSYFPRMEGAGEVEVHDPLASSEKIVEKDTNGESETITEEDSAGGNRRMTNIVNDETTVYGGKRSGNIHM